MYSARYFFHASSSASDDSDNAGGFVDWNQSAKYRCVTTYGRWWGASISL